MLRIQAAGTFGSTEVRPVPIRETHFFHQASQQMDYPNDRDVLESFECTRPVSFRSAINILA
jgi:cell cycle checkpoint protein